MEEEKKLHEKKSMEGRRLNEDEEDHKATLVYDLEKEIREVLEQIKHKGQYSMRRVSLITIERKYKGQGLSWEDIIEVRQGVMEKKNGK